MGKSLLFAGSPLLDITTSCSVEFLRKYNLNADDCIRTRKDALHTELFAEVLRDPSSEFVAGGSAQNSAKVAKWVLKDDHLAEVYFSGCVGKDEYAQVLHDVVVKNGVLPCYIKHDNLPTGICVCLVVNGEKSQRSMVTDLGASGTYNSQDLEDPKVRDAMEKADIIFTTGYFFSHSLDAVEKLAQFCHLKSKLFAISLSATYVCEHHSASLLKWLPYSDIVFGNLEEARTLLDKMTETKPNVVDTRSCAQIIANFPRIKPEKSRIAIITNGTAPISICLTNCESKDYIIPKISEVVDTIGCGDAMAGGFLASYVVENCVDKAIKTGILCAIEIAKHRGCTIPDYRIDFD